MIETFSGELRIVIASHSLILGASGRRLLKIEGRPDVLREFPLTL